MVETCATPAIWSRPTACETGEFRPQAARRVRLRHGQPCPRDRLPGRCAASLLFLPGFFTIPPIDRDEARFAQATKQMVESGDFVDIRFQDDVRYKKPVGIYWLQAAVVETASKLGLPRAQVRIWLYRVPSLIGAIGAVLLTYWTALAFVTRRGAVLAALMMCSSRAARRRSAARQDRCDAAADRRSPRWARWRGSICPGSAARIRRVRRGVAPAIFWTALAGGILLKGPLILMFVGLDDRRAGDPRPLGGLALAAAPGLGPDVDAGAGAAVVRRDLLARGRRVLHQFARRRHAEQARRAGIPWRAARPLSAAVLGHVLARRAAGGHGGAGGVAGAARARRAISAGLADPVLDRVRTGADQAAALRAAALSGDRHPDRRRAGAPGAVALLADARRGLVVRGPRGHGRDRDRRRDQADAPAGVSGLAVRWRRR